MINITGLWKNKSKNGTAYYKSPKLSKENKEKLMKALQDNEDFYFLIFNSNKDGNEKKPDIDLVVGDNKLKK